MTPRPHRDGAVVLCRLDEIDDPGARGVEVEVSGARLDLVVVRLSGQVTGFVNSCPHQGTPLETFPDRFLTRDGTHLICSTHGARFRAQDGLCVAGPCKGRSLRPVVVESRAGNVVLPAPPLDR